MLGRVIDNGRWYHVIIVKSVVQFQGSSVGHKKLDDFSPIEIKQNEHFPK